MATKETSNTFDTGFDSKPLLRGVSHLYAFYVSLVVGAVLVIGAHDVRATVAAVIYALATACMFGASALYHRVRWSPSQRLWMRRVDHSGIYLMIAGSYMPFLLIVLSGPLRIAMLVIVWVGAIAAIATRVFWVTAPGWVAVAFGASLGWMSLVFVPQAIDRLGVAGVALLAAGGALYTIGAIFYACKWPKLLPSVFGYHELFHALVIAAVVCQYAVVAFFVLPTS